MCSDGTGGRALIAWAGGSTWRRAGRRGGGRADTAAGGPTRRWAGRHGGKKFNYVDDPESDYYNP